MEVSGQPYALANSPQYASNSRLGGLHSQTGCCGEQKNFLTLPGIESCTVQPIAYYRNYAILT
jgi:hypothetical protein